MSDALGPYLGGLKDSRRAEKMIVTKTSSGRTIITKKPFPELNRGLSGSKKSMQKAVRQAVTYAEFAWEQPIYQSKAVGTSISAYNLAVADFLGKPRVLDIDLRRWGKGVGHTIQVWAEDNVMVLSVRLVIREGECILEEGEAVQSETDRLLWNYKIKSSIDRKPGLDLDAFAYDLPGNEGTRSVELR